MPDQLNLFQAWLSSSDDLPYATPGAPRICPAGDPTSGLMILVDMPAAEDCSSGSLLSGRVGMLFDRMMAAIGRNRESLYLVALSCLRSPNGLLAGSEAVRCAELARHHVGLARPRAVLMFGDGCARALLGASAAQARGRWHDLATPGAPVRAIATYSPAFLIDQPRFKAQAWADLQMLSEGLNA